MKLIRNNTLLKRTKTFLSSLPPTKIVTLLVLVSGSLFWLKERLGPKEKFPQHPLSRFHLVAKIDPEIFIRSNSPAALETYYLMRGATGQAPLQVDQLWAIPIQFNQFNRSAMKAKIVVPLDDQGNIDFIPRQGEDYLLVLVNSLECKVEEMREIWTEKKINKRRNCIKGLISIPSHSRQITLTGMPFSKLKDNLFLGILRPGKGPFEGEVVAERTLEQLSPALGLSIAQLKFTAHTDNLLKTFKNYFANYDDAMDYGTELNLKFFFQAETPQALEDITKEFPIPQFKDLKKPFETTSYPQFQKFTLLFSSTINPHQNHDGIKEESQYVRILPPYSPLYLQLTQENNHLIRKLPYLTHNDPIHNCRQDSQGEICSSEYLESSYYPRDPKAKRRKSLHILSPKGPLITPLSAGLWKVIMGSETTGIFDLSLALPYYQTANFPLIPLPSAKINLQKSSGHIDSLELKWFVYDGNKMVEHFDPSLYEVLSHVEILFDTQASSPQKLEKKDCPNQKMQKESFVFNPLKGTLFLHDRDFYYHTSPKAQELSIPPSCLVTGLSISYQLAGIEFIFHW